VYGTNSPLVREAISKHLKGIVTASRPGGGLQILCLLEHGWSEAKTIYQANAAGIELSGLSRLYPGENKTEGWILGYASLNADEIDTAMRRLAKALRS
jgi:GntR family transcriptional regulator/MocR family aminotransferase